MQQIATRLANPVDGKSTKQKGPELRLAIDSARCGAQYGASDLNTPQFGEVENLGAEDQGDDSRIVVKKYANRRLYNTATSSYVTLDHLARLTQEGVDFVVYDAKSGEDITRSVLTQIIVEEEAKGENLLPIAFLRQLITFYGDNMRWMVPQYLEHMIQSFAENQDRMRGAMQDAMGNLFPFGNLEDMRKQNMAFFEQAMRVWSPFAPGQAAAAPAGSVKAPQQPPVASPAPAAEAAELVAARAKAAQDEAALARLKAEIESLKAALEAAAKAPAPAPSETAVAAPLATETVSLPEAANSQAAVPPISEPAVEATPEPQAKPAARKPATRSTTARSSKAAPAASSAKKAAPAKAPAARRSRTSSTAAKASASKTTTAKASDPKKS